ncbi:MAG: heme o synthase [Saprospiraceae bacterium]|nr:heme o synthase [Saprospiraceae bacterium]MCF8248787.1 heme o synthase [Saprospiraceae bacterium]MCF8310072.1 heme o synthase [Saprospiraceae bacterium]MCF8438972.1 heme o synthase [Saprospiraceae bacterium]
MVSQKVRDFGELVKFKLSLTVVYSAVMAYLIAAEGSINWFSVLILSLGGFCVAGAANALNQVLERDFDKLMTRTANRPLATGRMTVSEAVLAAGILSIIGLMMLALFNPWASFFGVIALLSYAFLYTPMKRISPSAVAVGALPGALPMLIGCVAFQGELTSLALTLFLLQFFWQFPHFGAISWLGFEDYQKAGFKFVVAKDGKQDPSIGLQGVFYALCLVPVGLVPFYTNVTGVISAAIVSILALVYAWFGWNLYRQSDRKAAVQLMFFSFFYLPIALTALWLDKI